MGYKFNEELLKKTLENHKEIVILISLIIFICFILTILKKNEPFTNFKTKKNVLADFCQKMKLIDQNFIKSGDSFILEKQMFESILNDKKKKIQDLLTIINKFQKGIYYDKDEIAAVKNNNKLVNLKTKEQLKIINQAVKNLNSKLNPEIQIKI